MGTPRRRRCASSPTVSVCGPIASTSTSVRCPAVNGGAPELVRILFGGSELLLLDEPTNHLDADARTWLLKFLRSYRGALLVVSHDLDLLDEAITRVVHIDRESEEGTGTLVEYKGTYSQYLAAREGDQERTAKLAERQTREIAKLKAQAGGMRGQTAKRARVAKNLDGRRAKLEANLVKNTAKRRALAVRFPEPPSAGRTVLTATELYKSFGALDVFADVNFDVGRGERLLVMGFNGAGKTTLLRVLADVLSPDLGEVELGTHVSIGYYAQEHEGIVAGRTLLEHMREASTAGDGALRNLLGMFGLSGDKVFQDAGTLSGGEKTKLALAQLVAGTPQRAAARRAHQQPRSRIAHRDGRGAGGVARHHDRREPRHRIREVVGARPRVAHARRHARLLRRRDGRARRAGLIRLSPGSVG